MDVTRSSIAPPPAVAADPAAPDADLDAVTRQLDRLESVAGRLDARLDARPGGRPDATVDPGGPPS